MRKILPDNAILIPDHASRVFEGVIYDVYQWEQQRFDDSTVTFEMLKRPDTVSVLCLTDDGILVIDDEQPHRGSRVGFPGGRVDDTDESTLSAAKREVKEETGYEFTNWRLANVYQPQAKLEWFIHVYVAWGVSAKGDTDQDAGEKITTMIKPFDEVKRMSAQRIGYLGEAHELLENLESLQELQSIPEFSGKEVDR